MLSRKNIVYVFCITSCKRRSNASALVHIKQCLSVQQLKEEKEKCYSVHFWGRKKYVLSRSVILHMRWKKSILGISISYLRKAHTTVMAVNHDVSQFVLSFGSIVSPRSGDSFVVCCLLCQVCNTFSRASLLATPLYFDMAWMWRHVRVECFILWEKIILN
jgi:hypothetical protein